MWTERWLRPVRVEKEAGTILFLLPHSGAGASIFADWASVLPPSFAAWAVQLPGRQDRLAEPAFTDIAALVDELSAVVESELDGRPYVLFGHSMGALLGYRLAVRAAMPPALLAASGWAPAGFTRPVGAATEVSDEAIVDWMRSTGALSAVATAADEVVRVALPSMRADLAVVSSYLDDRAVVDCPVVSFSGAADPLMSPEAMASWRTRTKNYLGDRRFPGGHFFLREHRLAIAVELDALASAPAGQRHT